MQAHTHTNTILVIGIQCKHKNKEHGQNMVLGQQCNLILMKVLIHNWNVLNKLQIIKHNWKVVGLRDQQKYGATLHTFAELQPAPREKSTAIHLTLIFKTTEKFIFGGGKGGLYEMKSWGLCRAAHPLISKMQAHSPNFQIMDVLSSETNYWNPLKVM